MVMEDLSDHRIWRGELIANVYYPQAARQLGDYLAQVLFHTSDFYLHPHEKKAQVAQFINPAMCEITEDLFFNDPYQIHERNSYPAELEADVAALRDDAQLKLAVAALKHRFFAHAEALLHGDIHSGSIFVAEGSLQGHRRRVRLLRPHRLRYRYRHRQPAAELLRPAGPARHSRCRRRHSEQRLNDIHQLWTTFAERFQALAAEKTRDAALAYPGYALRLSEKGVGGRGRLLRQRTDPPQRRTVARRGYRHYPGRRHASRVPAPRHYPGQSADRAGRAYRQRRRAAGAGTPVQLSAPVSLTPTLSHREREQPLKKVPFSGIARRRCACRAYK